METLTIEFTKDEMRAIRRYAEQDMRDPGKFIRWTIREELQRRIKKVRDDESKQHHEQR